MFSSHYVKEIDSVYDSYSEFDFEYSETLLFRSQVMVSNGRKYINSEVKVIFSLKEESGDLPRALQYLNDGECDILDTRTLQV
jgi:hypothetical protein